MKQIISSLTLLLVSSVAAAGVIDLSGPWSYRLDRNEEGVKAAWYNTPSSETLNLPASLNESGIGDLPSLTTDWTCSIYDSSYYFNPAMAPYREEGNISLPFCLTPKRVYKGVAWYWKEVEVPKSWKGETVVFTMERPHIKTMVWVNGEPQGAQLSLCVPHVYDITSALKPGRKNLIAVLVDNTNRDTPVGKDSHSVSDQTQGNWNGIVGEISLRTVPAVRFEDSETLNGLEVYPDLSKHAARIRLALRNTGSKQQAVTVKLTADAYNGGTQHLEAVKSYTLLSGREEASVYEVTLAGLKYTWDEFTPVLYKIRAEVSDPKTRKVLTAKETTFGLREVSARGDSLFVNGRKTLLRGTVENCDFPLTGYAPMDTASWKRVFRICREWGLNHMRFHSYCPPEAAFTAADEVGFYLQPEGPSWPNHGVSLGRKEPIDTFLMNETKRITREYGNHPSFTFLSAGNEPRGNWVPWASAFVQYWQQADPRRLYTGFSVGGGWAWQPANQYHVKAGARGLDWRRQPGTMDDFTAKLDTLRQPFICHELGQWCVFPDFREMDQYTGVMEPRNFGIFKDMLAKNDMSELAGKFLYASGRLQTVCYKYEIEKLLRTAPYSGYQMLAINDYSGQGTALEGVLNVFFENKGYTTPEEFRQWTSPVVPLLRVPKFVWNDNDTVRYSIDISNYGSGPLMGMALKIVFTDGDGNVLQEKKVPHLDEMSMDFDMGLSKGVLKSLFTPSFWKVSGPKQVKMTVSVVPARQSDVILARNSWNFWIYPSAPVLEDGKVYVCDSLDAKAQEILAAGGDVLITAGGRVTYGRDVKQYWTPVFWNTSWFKMRPPHTTGIYLDHTHPAFSQFLTDDCSDLQWFELLNKTQVMLFTDFPQGFQPLVQSIDTWFLSRKIGVLFEARVGKGRLMMTTMDLKNDLNNRLVARQMRKSILDYMNSDRFQPKYEVDAARVSELFTKVAPPVDMFTKETPDELKPGFKKKAL